MYAAAGVPRYWVVDLDAERVSVHTGATLTGYATVETVGPGEELRAPDVGVTIAVAELLHAAAR